MGAYNDDEDLQRAFAAIKAQEEKEERENELAALDAVKKFEEQERIKLAASLVRLADDVVRVVQEVVHPQASSSNKSWDQNKQDSAMARGVASKRQQFGEPAAVREAVQNPIVRQQKNQTQGIPTGGVSDRKKLFENNDKGNSNKNLK